MASQSSTWYVDFFREDYLNVYHHLFTKERAEKEVAFAEHVLQLRAGASILDLCCGPGRHSVLFARRGYQVTSLDLNTKYLDMARKSAQEFNVTLEAIAADMRNIPFRDQFDAIVNMYSSFGYFESEAEDLKVLESAATAIKPGGRLMLDMLNREWAVANFIQNDWHSGEDGTLYAEHRDLDLAHSRMHVTFTIIGPHGGRRDSIGHHIRLYTLTETTRLLQKAGLTMIGVFGGFDAERYGVDTRRMIVMAQK
ncbi:MAG: methyltransferase domain-containing protein [Deltaproteobacteria bacterium]|nr:methyltransferase domain-containing protein [Deltaproteobacteria bacterium]